MKEWEIFYNEVIVEEGYTLILEGLKNTALIAVFGLLIGMLIGCLLATCQIIPKTNPFIKICSAFADVYIAIFRGTPMVVQLMLIHYVIFPALGIDIPDLLESILAFGLNSGAYVSEIMRGGILAVDIGQTEAGRALGLNYSKTMFKIVLPQAIKNVIPTLGNEFITLLKETSVVGFVSTIDITKAFYAPAYSTNEFIIPLAMLALTYLILVLIVTGIIKLIERRLRASDRR